jgi:hypothetical protein
LLLAAANPLPQTEKPNIRVHRDEHGAVTSQSAECSRIGIDVMEDGGNAVDAVRLIPSLSYMPMFRSVWPDVTNPRCHDSEETLICGWPTDYCHHALRRNEL